MPKRQKEKRGGSLSSTGIRIRVRAREFLIPPARDALVIGKRAPAGCVALQKTLQLLTPEPYVSVEVPNNGVISNIVVRKAILRKVPEQQLLNFVLRFVTPLMGETEVLDLALEVEVDVEAQV